LIFNQSVQVLQLAAFSGVYKKLWKNQKVDLDVLVAIIVDSLELGEPKLGDLALFMSTNSRAKIN
jgi:hypothetical protein